MRRIGRKTWLDLSGRYKKGFLTWVVCLLVFLLAMGLSWWSRHNLYDQQAATRWSEESDFAQLSCFYPVTMQPTDYEFQSLHHSIEDALKEASMETEGEKLFVDAYSMTGSLTISSENGTMEVKTVGVTDNFFLFHPVRLLQGSYFDENMLMKDGIILDEDAAFTLYGSNDVVGMPVYIGTASYYIRGVVERDEGYLAQEAGLDSSVCYVPADTLLTLGVVEGSYTYEVLMPSPVDGFAKNVLVTALNDTEGTLEVVENSSRFHPDARKEILFDYATRSMSSNGIIYPYWENLARATEDIVAVWYLVQVVTFLIFVALTIWYIWHRYKNRTWGLKLLLDKGENLAEKLREKRKHTKEKNIVGMLFLAVSISALLTGCNSSEETAAAAQSKEYVYSFESLDEKFSDLELSEVFYVNQRLVLTSYRYEDVPMTDDGGMDGMAEPGFMEEMPAEEMILEEAVEEVAEEEIEEVDEEVAVEYAVETDAVVTDYAIDEMYMEDMYFEEYSQNTYFKVTQVDLTGELLTEFEIQLPSDSDIYGFCADKNGNVYVILNEYGKDLSNPEWPRDLFSLVAYSENGEELYRTTLGEEIEEEEWYYVNKILCSEDGKVILATSMGVEVYEQDGTLCKLIKEDEAVNSEMYLLRDGKLGFLIYGNRGMYMKTMDLETEELSERIAFPFNAYEYSFYPGVSTDLLLSGSGGVYSFSFEEEGLTKVMDYVDSDLLSNNLYSLMETGENQLFGCFYDEETGGTRFGLFQKVDPSAIPDKKVLTLACYWVDDSVRRRVVEYNKTSEEYRIRIEDYWKYNTMDDYTIGMTKMNTDIASGNTPDIIMISSDMPVDSYVNKGLFADLNPFLENDPEIKKEDYTENIFEVFSQDGKLYQMVPSYYLCTIFGKASEVGEEPGWTMEDLQALRDKKGDEVAVFSDITQSEVLNYILLFANNQFVDWEKGECYFESPEFIELLEFANEFPKEIDYSELYNDQDYWEQQETMFRDGRALLMTYSLANFQDYQYCEKGTFGEPITAIGFPVKEGAGNVIMYNQNFAISAKSEYQQEAWEFIRYYWTEEYQDTIEYGWPVRKSSLNKMMEKAQEKPYYIDEFGQKVEYEDTYYIGGMEVTMDPLSQEDCERVVGFLNSAKDVYAYDQAIMNIVYEETAPYFDGQKTAEEVADIIQSRIYIYVNENR